MEKVIYELKLKLTMRTLKNKFADCESRSKLHSIRNIKIFEFDQKSFWRQKSFFLINISHNARTRAAKGQFKNYLLVDQVVDAARRAAARNSLHHQFLAPKSLVCVNYSNRQAK